MDDKKKKFIIPDAEVISFSNDDIITLSGGTETLNWFEDRTYGDNQEDF